MQNEKAGPSHSTTAGPRGSSPVSRALSHPHDALGPCEGPAGQQLLHHVALESSHADRLLQGDAQSVKAAVEVWGSSSCCCCMAMLLLLLLLAAVVMMVVIMVAMGCAILCAVYISTCGIS